MNDEVIFQEPPFSGSTSGNVLITGTSLVSDSMAHAGSKSDEINFQFVDGSATRWVRLTTFNTPNLPNPAMHVNETGEPAPTISFYAKGVLVPEPCAAVLMGLALVGLTLVVRRVN